MREAVIVSTARTPIGKAYRGAFNDLEAPTMGGHAIQAAVERVLNIQVNVGGVRQFQHDDPQRK